MRLPPRKRIAACVLPLVVGVLASVAPTAQAVSVRSITDPVGDTMDENGAPSAEPRADIVDVTAEHRPDAITLRLKTAEPKNPANDPNWADGFSAVGFAVDVNGDSTEEYQVEYGYDAATKKIYGEVYPAAGSGSPICSATSATFTANRSFEAVFDPNCFGAPERFWYAALMLYARSADNPDALQMDDRAPDGKGVFEGPVSLTDEPDPAPQTPAPQTPAPQPSQPGPEPSQPGPAPAPSVPGTGGYWLLGRDGGVFSFGTASYHGSVGGIRLNKAIVAQAANPAADGYWFVAGDGGIFSYGKAPFFGSAGDLRLQKPIVGMAATPSGRGYWLVASDGGVFAFGDAPFLGSTGAMRINRPIVGITATPSGRGYWLVASDGGIFAFGDASFYGSTGNIPLNRPIVGMAATPTGAGYWFAASDGGVFAYGDARYFGAGSSSAGASPVVGMAATKDGGGYRLVRADGSVLHYGNATNRGSMAGRPLAAPVVGIATAAG